MKNQIIKKYMYVFLIIIAVALVLELTVFNYKYYMTMGNKQQKQENFNTSNGLIFQGNNQYLIKGTGDSYIEIEDINYHVNSVKIEVASAIVDSGQYTVIDYAKNQKQKVSIYGTDAANQLYFYMGERSIVSGVPESEYMILHLSGNSEKLKLKFSGDNDTYIVIKDIILNPVIPFNFSLLRIFIITLFSISIYVLRPKSELYRIMYDSNKDSQKIVNVVLILIFIIMAGWLVNANPLFANTPFEHHTQYQQLARALVQGNTYIDSVPDEQLVSMDNPYDYGLRSYQHVSYLWDRAYYEGHYYVYFGIIPVCFYYLPGLLITGQDVPTHIGILLTAIAFFGGVMAVINAIIKTKFPKIPYLIYLYMLFMFITGCGLTTMLVRPDFYNFPILMAITLSLWGIYMWITSIKKNETGEKECSKSGLFLGSLCMALVAGCRPQLLLVSLVAIPILGKVIYRDKRIVLKGNLANIFSFVLPYIIILYDLVPCLILGPIII